MKELEDDTPDTLHRCDSLRLVDSLYEADVRNGFFSRRDADTGEIRPATVSDHISDVASFTLSVDVPKSIQIHFETAKNLYAYAWFVYRFYPVAEQQALTSLEFALRERLTAEVSQSLSAKGKPPSGLSAWLKQAQKRGVIANDRFSWGEERAMQRARQRAEFQLIQDMQCLGLTTAQLDYSNVKPTAEDFDEDWIGTFIDTLPALRNTYAHGSDLLHNTVLHTFEIVSELINQLFAPAR